MLSDLLEKQEILKGAVERLNQYQTKPEEIKIEYSKKNLIDISEGNLKFDNDSVDQFTFTYVIEFLKPNERIKLIHELYRTLKNGGKATIYSSYWAASKAFGDLDVQWPPVTEAWYSYIDKDMREKLHSEDTNYTECNFVVSMGYGMHQSILGKHEEARQHALIFYKEAAQDLVVTLTKL